MSSLWLLIFIFSLVIESITSALIVIWLAPAAAIALISLAFGLSSYTQVSIFVIVYALCFMLIRPYAISHRNEHLALISSRVHSLVGEKATVEEPISYLEYGTIRIDDQTWVAAPDDAKHTYKEGDRVEIVALDDEHVIVRGITK